METTTFLSLLEERIQRYDLLTHPFYKAWAAGELSREDLRMYAEDYYPHVEAFPGYLGEFGARLVEGELRSAVFANMADETGGENLLGERERAHGELWLDFVEGLGGSRARKPEMVAEVAELVAKFKQIASEGTPEEALAAFYAYESQVPRVAKEKERGLRELYGADEKTRAYFALHSIADVYHSQVWRQQLEERLCANPFFADKALRAAENVAQALWNVLDGVESRRLERASVSLAGI